MSQINVFDKIAARLELVLRNAEEVVSEEKTLEYQQDLNTLKMITGQLKIFHKPEKAKIIARTSFIKYVIKEVLSQSRPAPETSNIESLLHSPQSSDSGTP